MAETSRNPLRGALGAIALLAPLAVIAYWLLFTTFKTYDDEGYVLLSLRHFAEHGRLYDGVYTQYGPFPYLLYDALHRFLAFEFTNASGRWITLVNWLLAAAACGLLVWRVTRSLAWSAFTLVLTFTHLWVMINEPAHPGGLIAAMLGLAACVGTELWLKGRTRLFAGIMASAAALLLLTKINVGAFFAIAFAVWLALHSPPRVARWAMWLILPGCALLPVALTSSLFDQPWVQIYSLLFCGAAVSTTLTLFRAAVPMTTMDVARAAALAGTASAVLVCFGAWLRGTSSQGLVDGIFFEPLRHPGVYSFPMKWTAGTGGLALVSLAIAAWTFVAGLSARSGFRTAVACARVLIAMFFFLIPLRIVPIGISTWVMCYGISLVWLFIVPLSNDSRSAKAQGWLGLLVVFQFLHGYPVAGSQIHWGTFLWIPLLALGVCEAAPLLLDRLGAMRKMATLASSATCAGAALFVAAQLGNLGWQRFENHIPLQLPGAHNLRLPPEEVHNLRVLTHNIRAHGDVLFSLPGIFSTNLWTNLPTPTLANVTLWFSLLSPTQQEEIIRRLARSPRAIVLHQVDLTGHLLNNNIPVNGPVVAFLKREFRPALRLGSYEMWVSKKRRLALLNVAELRKSGRDGTEATLSVRLRMPQVAIATIDVCELARPEHILAMLNARNTQPVLTPISADGTALGPASSATFPILPPEWAKLVLQVRLPPNSINWSRALLVFRDPEGKVLTEARVFP